MKNILLILCFVFVSQFIYAQTTIWTEDFSSGGTGWNLNVVNGTEGTDPNFFTVSDNEGGGLNAGACGVANNGNNTLHVTSVFNPNGGASYDAGGLCGIFTCPLTNRSAISPTFSAVGYSGLQIQFKYIENGQGSIDNATMTVSNGISNFTLDMAKTALCTSGQGQWSAYTANAPTGFLGTANMTITFKWVNNDDGIGTDPSLAIDDIQVSGSSTTSNTITTLAITTPIANNTYCPCDSGVVNFTSTGTFNAGNIYTAQLSDPNGSFASPSTIGTLSSSSNSGSIAVLIPCNALYGTGYRIRVVSSNPSIIGTDNGTNLTINATPNITITASPSGVICPGTPVTFTASPNLSPNFSYQWYRSLSSTGPWTVMANANPNTLAPLPGSNFYYRCIITNVLCGTTDTSNLITVTVAPNINIVTSLTPNQSNVCPGGSMALCATASVPISSFSWTGGISNCVAFAPSATNTYTVTATDANGCTKTSTTQITVGPLQLGLTSTPTNASVCNGSPLTLCASGASNYSWTGGITNCSPFTTYTNGTTYTVTGTDGNGCTATSTITVNALSLPSISVTSTPSNATVCTGSPITLCASGASSYSWSGGIINCVPFNPQTGGIYIVSGTDANGCTGTSSVNVTLQATPTVSISATPSNATICNGNPLTLCATGGATSYTWTGGVINCTAFNPNTSATYSVTATDTNGCSTTSSIPVTVFNMPIVNISLTPNTTTICQGDPLTLCASGSASSYSWSGSVVNCSPNTNLSSGVYTVTAANGACITTSSVAITVNPSLVPSISISSLPTPVVVGQMTNFTANVGAATSYQIKWYRGGGLLQTTNYPVNDINTICASVHDSIYAVIIPNGCYSPDSAISNVIKPTAPESIAELNAMGINMYPNPVQGELHISNAPQIESATLCAINGDVLQVVNNTAKQEVITLELHGLARGLYILKLNLKGNTYYQKVIKE